MELKWAVAVVAGILLAVLCIFLAAVFIKWLSSLELTGGKGITFATGTPISNSMTELYTNMRYLQHDTLQRLGLGHFDSWASKFGEVVTAIDIARKL